MPPRPASRNRTPWVTGGCQRKQRKRRRSQRLCVSRTDTGSGPSLALLQAGGAGAPLFCIHGLGGHVAAFVPLARELAKERAVFGLQARGLEAGQRPLDSIAAMAASYVGEIRGAQTHGPYLLMGWSLGGLIALEVAQQLVSAGQEVTRVVLLDTYLSLTDVDLQDSDDVLSYAGLLPA